MLLGGAMGAGIGAILLTVFPVDVCREHWQVGPAALLGAAALLLILIIPFRAMPFVLGTGALVLAGFAAWVFYLASALGCE